MPKAAKLGRALTYLKGLLAIKPLHPLIMQLFKMTLLIKTLYIHFHNACGHQTWKCVDI